MIEYPQTTVIRERVVKHCSSSACFNAPEDLRIAWNRDNRSSEPYMLAVLAHKWNLEKAPTGRGKAVRQPEYRDGGGRPHGMGEKRPLLRRGTEN